MNTFGGTIPLEGLCHLIRDSKPRNSPDLMLKIVLIVRDELIKLQGLLKFSFKLHFVEDIGTFFVDLITYFLAKTLPFRLIKSFYVAHVKRFGLLVDVTHTLQEYGYESSFNNQI